MTTNETPTLWGTALRAVLIGLAGAVAMLGTELLLFPGLARAADASVGITVDATCVAGCLTAARACVADARASFADCSIQDGCVELAAAARTACMGDSASSLCVEARAQYRDCIQPCRAALRTDIRTCQNNSLTCLREDCGLVDLPEQCRRVSVTATAP